MFYINIFCICPAFLWTFYRQIMPERKQIKTSVQSGSAVPWHIRGGGGGGRTRVTNAISYVQSLQSIVAKCDQISLLPNNHSFTFMSAVTHYTKSLLKKQNDNSGTFRAIATEKCMSYQMAKKCAGSGLLFMHLQLAFQRDGVHEFYDVLCEEINNKPRVTKNKVVIAKQKIAISNTNYLIY